MTFVWGPACMSRRRRTRSRQKSSLNLFRLIYIEIYVLYILLTWRHNFRKKVLWVWNFVELLKCIISLSKLPGVQPPAALRVSEIPLKLIGPKKKFTKNWTHLQFYKRNPFKNYSEQKKINHEIRSQKYPLGRWSWRPFLKKSS